MDIRLVLLGGILGCFVIASFADGMVLRGAARLAPAVRERVYQRSVRTDLLLRLLDTLGIALLILGLLGLFGLIKGGPQFAWRSGAVCVGFAILCLERILRSWLTHFAMAREEGTQEVRGRALAAAVLVTLVEGVLGGVVCWWILTNFKYVGPTSSGNAPATEENRQDSATPGAGRTRQHAFVSEAEALQILGREKAYLELLVKHGELKPLLIDGRRSFNRKNVETLKRDGLPAREELEPKAEPEEKQDPPREAPEKTVQPGEVDVLRE